MSQPREHNFTKEMVCPYCHKEQSDSWEVESNDYDGATDCGFCGEEFQWFRHIAVDYSTAPRSTP